MTNEISQAVTVLKAGGIIVYPTEGVYGIGCDFCCERAVKKVLSIKQRLVDQGLILIAANWEQAQFLIKDKLINLAVRKNHAPITWVFKASPIVPRWITGKFDSVAIRVTTHPEANLICQRFGKPIVSTSANLSGKVPPFKFEQLSSEILEKVDLAVKGEVEGSGKASVICDAISGKIYRR